MASGLSIPRAEPTTCRIQLSQGSTPLKYLSSKLNEFGEYGILTDSATQALEVTFTTGNSSEQIDLRVTVAEGGTPMMGGITGFFNEGDDLVSGSYNYAYIGLTSQTPSGSIPQSGANSFDKINNYSRKIESAIWLFDVATRQVVPQWVNTNKSTPKNSLVYVDKQNVLVITADKDRFLGEFEEEFEVQGVIPVEVNMRCVE
ncbi:unnamed protein product [Rhizoctonia solani]|uniref:Uncharacterized protein n=1 Tax=Rhizoctonia solani TaxID=456999 RepID=A0A8H2XLB7_9AGAM|nr:unnamed protein product [Rhizoctonia solani]